MNTAQTNAWKSAVIDAVISVMNAPTQETQAICWVSFLELLDKRDSFSVDQAALIAAAGEVA